MATTKLIIYFESDDMNNMMENGITPIGPKIEVDLKEFITKHGLNPEHWGFYIELEDGNLLKLNKVE